MLKANKVYLIQFEYSTEDCQGSDIYLFKTRKSALAKFKELVNREIEFYKNDYGHIDQKNFELDTNMEEPNLENYYWNYQCKADWYLHTNLELTIKEVQK